MTAGKGLERLVPGGGDLVAGEGGHRVVADEGVLGHDLNDRDWDDTFEHGLTYLVAGIPGTGSK